jgi:hypothetical protein
MAQAIRDEVLDELLQGYTSPQDLLGEEGYSSSCRSACWSARWAPS